MKLVKTSEPLRRVAIFPGKPKCSILKNSQTAIADEPVLQRELKLERGIKATWKTSSCTNPMISRYIAIRLLILAFRHFPAGRF